MDLYPTIENWTAVPGAIAPADGSAAGSLPVIPSEARNPGYAYDTASLDPSASAARTATSARDDNSKNPIDLGPNNERLEDAKPELVHALRELVRAIPPGRLSRGGTRFGAFARRGFFGKACNTPGGIPTT